MRVAAFYIPHRKPPFNVITHDSDFFYICRMKRLFLILAFIVVAVSGFGQTRPNPVIHHEDDSFTYYKEYGVGYSLSEKRSIYGNVRIISNGRADLQVCFVKCGEIHDFDVRVVNREPMDGEWQFVTGEGEEDFTIRITDIFAADVAILVTEGYDPLTKKYVKKK